MVEFEKLEPLSFANRSVGGTAAQFGLSFLQNFFVAQEAV